MNLGRQQQQLCICCALPNKEHRTWDPSTSGTNRGAKTMAGKKQTCISSFLKKRPECSGVEVSSVLRYICMKSAIEIQEIGASGLPEVQDAPYSLEFAGSNPGYAIAN
ncbi:UNVERIFIED_CONTAM: hypothetical protein FKN15_022834 [Acipenser sinensis]